MTVSVVIPVFNERAFIEEILFRVQASLADGEIIVVDDNSTDGTRALLKEFAKKQSEGNEKVLLENGTALSLENIYFVFSRKIKVKVPP